MNLLKFWTTSILLLTLLSTFWQDWLQRYQSAWFSLNIGIGIYSLIYTDKSLHALNHQGISSHICMMYCELCGHFLRNIAIFLQMKKNETDTVFVILFMCTNNAQKQHWSKGADLLNMLQNYITYFEKRSSSLRIAIIHAFLNSVFFTDGMWWKRRSLWILAFLLQFWTQQNSSLFFT